MSESKSSDKSPEEKRREKAINLYIKKINEANMETKLDDDTMAVTFGKKLGKPSRTILFNMYKPVPLQSLVDKDISPFFNKDNSCDVKYTNHELEFLVQNLFPDKNILGRPRGGGQSKERKVEISIPTFRGFLIDEDDDERKLLVPEHLDIMQLASNEFYLQSFVAKPEDSRKHVSVSLDELRRDEAADGHKDVGGKKKKTRRKRKTNKKKKKRRRKSRRKGGHHLLGGGI